jgi:hypothetical protein
VTGCLRTILLSITPKGTRRVGIIEKEKVGWKKNPSEIVN